MEFLRQSLIQQYKSVDIFELRFRNGIKFIAGTEKLCALFQFIVAFREDFFVTTGDMRHAHGDDSDAKTLHQFAFVEDNTAERLRAKSDLKDAHAAEVFQHAHDAGKAV